MPWDRSRPFTLPVVPLPGDIDGLNHTNNAVYVQWCEKVAWAHSESLGQRQAQYDYLLPTALGEELLLATWLVASDGKLTMRRAFQLVRARDRATAMRGHWDLVCIELTSGRPRRMPAEFVQAYLAALVEAPAP